MLLCLSMRRLLLAALLLIGSGAACASVVAPTASGPVSGESTDGVVAFKGIPYAAAPVGELRWRPPQRVAPWTEPRQTLAFGAACPQPPRRDRADRVGSTDEDCLYLNVWTAALAGKRPVMVWIHGGAFRLGSGSLPIYDGTRFAQHGVVLVTLNYRLGRFGFFAHPALADANPGDARGNYGLMDQAAALEWVKTNIATFGGDPANVTVFGESAGGSAVLHLLTSPRAVGLFHKAIIESGGGHQIDRRLDGARGQRESLIDQGVTWAASVGANGGAAALRATPAQQVLGDGQLAEGLGGVGPVIDGDWVPDDPGVRLRDGQFAKVPLLIGANSYEASVLAAFGTDANRLVASLGVDIAELRTLYAGLADSDTAVANQAFGDAAFVAGARHVARSAARFETPVYLYHFDYVLERRRGKVPGAAHGVEIPYAFDSFGRLPALVRMLTTERDAAMAATMHRYWINFATSGDPNIGGDTALPQWPRYTVESDQLLLLRSTIEAAARFRAPQLDVFQQRWEGAEAR